MEEKPKDIVICCDGTNNQVESSPTSVFLLFQALKNVPGEQETLYLPGVGTMASPGLDTPIRRRLSILAGLAFGAGLKSDYQEAYRFLMQTYRPGDRIYIFGFSRGGLTARAIAGMVHMFGLLRPGQEALVPYLARHFERANFEVIQAIRRFSRRRIKIEFLGLWDSVASYGFAYSRRTLPFTANNRDVKVVRHALAIDERRAYFRAFRWGKRHSMASRQRRKLRPVDQSVREVWFSGVHSDVGGGYADGALSRIPFEWMLEELHASGARLQFNSRYLDDALGREPDGPFVPDPCAPAHESLTGAWWPVELLPKNGTLRRGDFEWPFGRRRHMGRDPQGKIRVHESVFARRAAYGGRYRPLPLEDQEYEREPWSGAPPAADRSRPLPSLPALRRVRSIAASVALFGLLGLFAASLLWSALRWVAPLQSALIVFGLPVFTLWLGGRYINLKSGLSSHSYKLRRPLVYLLWKYTHEDLARNIRHLDKDAVRDGSRMDGVASLRRALQIDLWFPLVYGPALWFTSVTLAVEAAQGREVEHPVRLLVLLGILPLITMVADWIENGLLLSQAHRTPFRPDPRRIAIASRATQVKLVGYALCSALPPFLWLVMTAWRNFF